jgi:hypothetical protein
MQFGAAPVLQQIEEQRLAQMTPVADQPNVFDSAVQQYPVLKELGLVYKRTPRDDGGLLEFWPPGEPGGDYSTRPKEFPLNSPGVEVYSDKVRPIDILGDVVSHHLVETDPTIKRVYGAFEKSVTPEQEAMLRKQYDYARENQRETRPYEDWRERTGMPGFFRGHPFQQWPDEFNQQVYTPEQIKLLDAMMQRLTVGNKAK